MKDWFKAGAIPQAEVKAPIDIFENVIREMGVGFACEWFGHEKDGHFAKETVNELCRCSGMKPPFQLVNGEYI